MAEGLAWGGWCFSLIAVAASIYVLGFALAGVRLRKVRPLPAPPFLPSFLVLIPAHDEAAGIAATIASLRGVTYPPEKIRVVTVADNCSDATAAVARAAGSAVWERDDAARPGKGQALAWAMGKAADEAYDCVVIIDADTVVSPDYFNQVAAAVATYPNSVYQGRYEFLPAPGQAHKWFETLTLASKAAENTFIYLPRSAAGLVNLLQGNGFCISREALQRVPLAASSITEDAEYALELALAGIAVRYVDSARVYARMTAHAGDAAPQRLRWASGIFRLCRYIPRLVLAGIRRHGPKLLEAPLMLLLTSRILLVSVTAVALALSLAAGVSTGLWAPSGVVLAACCLQGAYLILVFRKSSDTPYSLVALVGAPFYWFYLSIIQLAALAGVGRKRWTRTAR